MQQFRHSAREHAANQQNLAGARTLSEGVMDILFGLLNVRRRRQYHAIFNRVGRALLSVTTHRPDDELPQNRMRWPEN